jgi:hypothetical protein
MMARKGSRGERVGVQVQNATTANPPGGRSVNCTPNVNSQKNRQTWSVRTRESRGQRIWRLCTQNAEEAQS